MYRHDIIAIGASAGGVDALRAIARALPAGLPAAVYATLHIPADSPSLLPELLTMAGPLPASHAVHGQPIAYGQITVAPPDHHLLIERTHVHVVRGPKENGFRPAIDAMLRTAAYNHGTRVIGVILTGMLDDGTAGLLAVKRYGGVAVVQDPADASYPSMPESALKYVAVDRVLPLAELAPVLIQLVGQAGPERSAIQGDPRVEREVEVDEMKTEALHQAADSGARTPFSCPDCGGVLVEYYDGDLLRFRCQVGHAFSRESMFASQAQTLDYGLWAAFRALDERVNLATRLASDASRQGDTLAARRFERLCREADARREQIRLVLGMESEQVEAG